MPRGLYLLINSGSSRVISLLAFLLLARRLQTADFGLVVLATTIAAPLSQFASRGFPLVLTKFAATASSEQEKLSQLSHAADRQKLLVVTPLVLSGISLLAIILISGQSHSVLLAFGVVLLASSGTSALLDSSLINGMGLSIVVYQINTLKYSLLFGAVLLIPYFSSGPLQSLIILAITDGLAAVSLYIFIRRRIPRAKQRCPWKRVLPPRDTNLCLISAVVTGIAYWSLPTAVSVFSSFEQTAALAVCQRWAQIPLFTVSALSSATFPRLVRAQNEPREIRRKIAVGLAALIFVTCAIPSLFLASIAAPLLKISGPSYDGFRVTFYFLLISAVLSSVNTLIGQWILAKNETAWWLLSDLVLAAVILGGIIVARDGLTATSASLITVFAYFCTVCVLLYPLVRRRQAEE